MAFELAVVKNTPLTPHDDVDEVCMSLLSHVGYLGRTTDEQGMRHGSVAYRLFKECFLLQPTRSWTAEELLAHLESTKPTLYRHLNKLKALDILEEDEPADESGTTGRKAYRMRYGDFGKAWNFTEANVKAAMENHRVNVRRLAKLAPSAPAAAPGAASVSPGMDFSMLVVNNLPITGARDVDDVAFPLLRQVGYLSWSDDEGTRESVPYRLFREHFLLRPDRAWNVDELTVALGVSRPTVLRHVGKLKLLDLLEETTSRDEPDGGGRKSYRLRHGSIERAWPFLEAHVKVAMENYRRSVDHLQALAERSKEIRR
jgi:DNA-binding transcriptional ArsR family regulator